MQSARPASPHGSAEIPYQYPQKSPQWLGHFSPFPRKSCTPLSSCVLVRRWQLKTPSME